MVEFGRACLSLGKSRWASKANVLKVDHCGGTGTYFYCSVKTVELTKELRTLDHICGGRACLSLSRSRGTWKADDSDRSCLSLGKRRGITKADEGVELLLVATALA